MKVSVVVTSYNQASYLKLALDSVLQQTVLPTEIIVADDHSTRDDSPAVIRQYQSDYPHLVRGLFHHENLGIPRNRNSALREVKGDYVAILDGDDRLLPGFVEKHLAALRSNPSAGASYSDRYLLTASGERKRRNTTPEPSGQILSHIARGRSGILRSLLARYDFVKAAGLLDERFYHHDGFVLTLRLARLTPFVYLAEPLMEKREHAEGISRGISPAERARCYRDLLGEVMQQVNGLSRSEQKEIRRLWQSRIVREEILAEAQQSRMKGLRRLMLDLLRDPRTVSLKLARKIWSTGPSVSNAHN